ncbi:hypothetical protein ACFSY7_12285 [Kurthia populi]|uniref:DUF676 domain-containing protein n=1 Tax=Kurthia populi TaxID=1562132 RepID=A0ABW5Y1S1_9BACL
MKKKAKLNLILDKKSATKSIIFIHGLGGDALKTWQEIGVKSLPELFSEDEDLQDFKIYSFQYPSGIVLKQYNIDEISRLLMTEIIHELKNVEHIFLISHSQGGIIARKLILNIFDKEKEFVKKFKGSIYLSVPFEGATGGSLIKMFSSFVPSILGKWIFSDQTLSLELFSKELSEISTRWNNLNNNRKLPHLKEMVMLGMNDKVVNSVSAKPDYILDYHEFDENHKSISKFNDKSSKYKIIKEFILRISSEEKEILDKIIQNERKLIIIADEYFAENEFEKAKEEYLKALTQIDDDKLKEYIRYRIAHCHLNLAEKFPEAKENYLLKAIKNLEEVKNSSKSEMDFEFYSVLGGAYFELASIRNAVINLRKSREAHIKSLSLCNVKDFPMEYLITKNNIAITYIDTAEYEHSESNLREAIILLMEIVHHDKVTRKLAWLVFNNLGRCFEKLSTVSKTEESYLLRSAKFYKEALEVVRLENDLDDYILSLNNLGNAYVLLLNVLREKEYADKALECFNEVFEIVEKSPNSYQYCTVLNNLGNAYYNLFSINQEIKTLKLALSYFEKSLEHKELQKLPIKHGRTQLNYGRGLMRLAEFENKEINFKKAIKCFERAIRLSHNNNSPQSLVALAYLKEIELEKSIDDSNYEKIYRIIDELKCKIQSLDSIGILNLNNNYHYKFFDVLNDSYNKLMSNANITERELNTLNDGLQLFEGKAYKLGTADLHRLIGTTYAKLNRDNSNIDISILNTQIEHYFKASEIYGNLDYKYSNALVKCYIAESYIEKNDIENNEKYIQEAKNYYEQAQNILEPLIGNDEKYEKLYYCILEKM